MTPVQLYNPDAGQALGFCPDGSNTRPDARNLNAVSVMSSQDVSTMIRYRLNPVIFLINNGGYTIEVEIHDGPYNTIQGWDYAGLVQCFDNHQGNVFSTKVPFCFL